MPSRRSFRTFLAAWGLLWLLAAAAGGQSKEGSGEGTEARILSPTDQDFMAGKVRLACWAKPAPGASIVKVEFYVDGKLVHTATSEPYSTIYEAAADDLSGHTVRVVAYDSNGGKAEDQVATRSLEMEATEEVFLVELFATVMDGDRHFVQGLKKEAFEVTEDKAVQEIAFFSSVVKPLSLAILVDTSGSMEEKIYKAQEGAVNFVYKTLTERDEAMIVTFDTKVRLAQELTADKRKLERAILNTTAGGATVMYDAIAAATYKLNQLDNSRRKAIILLSDGLDEGSTQRPHDVLEYTKKSDITIYAVGIDVPEGLGPGFGPMGRVGHPIQARRDLEDFSKVTGGDTYIVEDIKDLKGVYEKIGDDLRHQYSMAYYPSNRAKDGKWRKIKVKAADGQYKVRTRSGYYAPAASSPKP